MSQAEYLSIAHDPDYAGILVSCPVPGKENLPAEPLTDFMETERGQRVLGESLKNVETLVGTGKIGKEEAIRIALGSAAVTDEHGRLIRAPREELSSPLQTAESKKK